jgi:hypothetical protein
MDSDNNVIIEIERLQRPIRHPTPSILQHRTSHDEIFLLPSRTSGNWQPPLTLRRVA